MEQAMHIHAHNKFLKFSMNKKNPKKVGSSTNSRKLFFHGVHGGGASAAAAGNISAHAQPPFEFVEDV